MIPIDVRSKSDGLEQGIHQFAEHRMSFALDRLRGIRRIAISVQDINGPRGGVDKYCRVIANFGFGSIVIEETQQTWQSALTRAIRRLSRRASQEMQRVNRSAFHNRPRARHRSPENDANAPEPS